MEKYNGWTNWETWETNNFLTTDYYDYIIDHIKENNPSTYDLAEFIKNILHEESEHIPVRIFGLFESFINMAINTINFNEIAAAFMEGLK